MVIKHLLHVINYLEISISNPMQVNLLKMNASQNPAFPQNDLELCVTQEQLQSPYTMLAIVLSDYYLLTHFISQQPHTVSSITIVFNR